LTFLGAQENFLHDVLRLMSVLHEATRKGNQSTAHPRRSPIFELVVHVLLLWEKESLERRVDSALNAA
jgi:hypothetical protein